MSDDTQLPKFVTKILSFYFNKSGKRFTPDIFQSILNLRKTPPDILNNEIVNFQNDIKKYRSGVFFWMNEYPNVVLIYSILGVNIHNLQGQGQIPDMKVVISEYYDFIEHVKKKNLKSYDIEINESHSFFNGEMQPINLKTKDLLINSLHNRIIKIHDEISPQIKTYAEKLIIEMNRILINSEQVNPLKILIFLKKIKKLQKEAFPSLNDISKETEIIIDDFRRICTDNTSIAYLELSLIKNIDSFNVNFTKFLVRLFIILSKGKRESKQQFYLLYNPDSKKYDPKTRKKLKGFLKNRLGREFPNLSEYILSMFKYNMFRILESHRNPLVRIDGGFAYFSNPNRKDLYLDLHKIMKVTKTYNFFIDSLGFF